MKWYLKVLKKYIEFNGRASRAEFWYFQLFNLLIYGIFMAAIVVAAAMESLIFAQIIYILMLLYGVVILLPGLAVAIRRLHDTGRSGWWYFIILIPVVGVFIWLYFMIEASEEGANKFGILDSDNMGQRDTQTISKGNAKFISDKPLYPNVNIDRKGLTMGRRSEIVIDNDYVSSQHLEVGMIDANTYYVKDLGSSNGTYIEGHKLIPYEEKIITEGTPVILGSEEVVYYLKIK